MKGDATSMRNFQPFRGCGGNKAVDGGYGMQPAVMGAQTGVMPSSVMGAQTAPFGYGAMPVNQAPANVTAPIVSPTQQTVNTNVIKTIVPHVHPSHNTTVNKFVYQHQHYFPHSESVVNECYNQQLICTGPPPMPVNPCCPPRPWGF